VFYKWGRGLLFIVERCKGYSMPCHQSMGEPLTTLGSTANETALNRCTMLLQTMPSCMCPKESQFGGSGPSSNVVGHRPTPTNEWALLLWCGDPRGVLKCGYEGIWSFEHRHITVGATIHVLPLFCIWSCTDLKSSVEKAWQCVSWPLTRIGKVALEVPHRSTHGGVVLLLIDLSLSPLLLP
jgi:hypothetical protein